MGVRASVSRGFLNSPTTQIRDGKSGMASRGWRIEDSEAREIWIGLLGIFVRIRAGVGCNDGGCDYHSDKCQSNHKVMHDVAVSRASLLSLPIIE